MPTYRAKCWLGSSSGYQELEVKSNTPTGAKEQFERIYGAEEIVNLSEVFEHDQYSPSKSDSSIGCGGILGIATLFGILWVFFSFAPWILMSAGGAFGTWFSQKITGQEFSDYCDMDEPSTSQHLKATFVLALTLFMGGLGYYQGDKINKEFIESQSSVQIIVNELS